ncbi:MAG: radical SAM protein [Candidatus Pelagibacter sp.]
MKNSLTANEYYKRQVEYTKLAFEKQDLMPRRYVLVLTNMCNLSCTFCFQERKKRADRMTTEHWMNLLDQIPKNSRITLTGGDPFMFKDFDKIFMKANQIAETNMITNGLLINDQKIESLLEQKNFKVLAISIDTIGNTNRDVKPKDWDKLLVQLNKFIKLRDKKNLETALDIKTVILDENIDDLFEIHRFATKTLKADTHSFMLLKGAEIQHSDLMFNFEQIDKETEAYQYKKFDKLVDQLNKIKEYDYKYGYKSFLHPNILDFKKKEKFQKEELLYLNNKKHESQNYAPCYAPWGCVYINVDGNLFPCMAVSMGNVKTTKLKEIIFSETFKKFKNIIRSKGTINGCNRCGYLKPKYI